MPNGCCGVPGPAGVAGQPVCLGRPVWLVSRCAWAGRCAWSAGVARRSVLGAACGPPVRADLDHHPSPAAGAVPRWLEPPRRPAPIVRRAAAVPVSSGTVTPRTSASGVGVASGGGVALGAGASTCVRAACGADGIGGALLHHQEAATTITESGAHRAPSLTHDRGRFSATSMLVARPATSILARARPPMAHRCSSATPMGHQCACSRDFVRSAGWCWPVGVPLRMAVTEPRSSTAIADPRNHTP